ncbi:H-type lectin domain-containing protein [Micromonospora sp. NBC_01655]|uniref:H-type lectin domain-containing protein n=1 Tax=Micromonospora sp. NBC_01655 TaxID=2975983 RepID=UPI00224E4BA2|nr:H-type lectin domain-containing protein [Micromonospora sp. NBC_01655]MCX4468972.1 H-type lectin domain-containing protein [Micromonospora sp. NBC_01655]
MAVRSTHWKSGMRLTPARLGEEECGELSVSFTTLATYSQAVTFAEAFRSPPNVVCNIMSGANVTARYDIRAYNVTATGFWLWAQLMDAGSAAQTWSGVTITWVAKT